MNGYERTKRFLSGDPVDRAPFMPLVIDWVARRAGLTQEEFVYDVEKQARAYLQVTAEYNIDCLLPDTDFFVQLEDFGMQVEMRNGRYHGEPVIEDIDDPITLALPEISGSKRMGGRLEVIRLLAEHQKGIGFIFGTCIGPLTEFCNARGTEDALMDLLAEPERCGEYMELFLQNGLRFIEGQINAGADGIQIVEPNGSIISPALFEDLVLPMHRRLVDAIHKLGGVARLHICGDTNRIIPMLLATGVDILDADHPVAMGEASRHLGRGQALLGNIDPSGDLLLGTPEAIREKVRAIAAETGNRTIISAGCDVPEETKEENMRAFFEACEEFTRAG